MKGLKILAKYDEWEKAVWFRYVCITHLYGLAQAFQCRGLHRCYDTSDWSTFVYWFDSFVTWTLIWGQQKRMRVKVKMYMFTWTMKCLECISRYSLKLRNLTSTDQLWNLRFLRLWSWCFYYLKGWWIITVFSRKVLGTKMHINFCTSESCMWSLMGKSSSSWKRREALHKWQHEHITTTNQMKAVNVKGIYK